MFKRSIIFLLIVALISSMIFTHNYSQKEVKAASNDVHHLQGRRLTLIGNGIS